MSAKVNDAPTIEVPEASPQTNDQKQTNIADENIFQSRRNLWMALAALFAIVLTASIAVPVSLNQGKENGMSASTTAGISNQPVPIGIEMCFEPDECINEASHQHCVALANSGCKAILSTFSCPPLYRCGDEKSIPEVAIDCTMEVKKCQDGSFVGRLPPSCAFDACPDDAVACPTDTKKCPDGSFVSRSAPSCEFEACPEEPVACSMEVKACVDGSFVGRTGPACEFEPCPEDVTGACSRELAICPDGTPVGRSGPNC